MGDEDRLELRGLRVTAIIGALPEERERPQPLLVDLDAVADLTTAGRTDALDDTIDYGAMCRVAASVITAGRFVLLERAAASVAEAVLAVDDRIRSVTATVRKLHPPVPHDLSSAGVRITARRGA